MRLASVFVVVIAVAVGCGEQPSGVDRDLATGIDLAGDFAAPVDLASPVRAGDGGPGAECTFNRDCVATARCACSGGSCACETGPRGTGKNGVDRCVDGNDCESALCVEGPGGEFYCSDECATPADCGPALPRCIDVAFVGRICVRNPQAANTKGRNPFRFRPFLWS
jgi:hypothetical protein